MKEDVSRSIGWIGSGGLAIYILVYITHKTVGNFNSAPLIFLGLITLSLSIIVMYGIFAKKHVRSRLSGMFPIAVVAIISGGIALSELKGLSNAIAQYVFWVCVAAWSPIAVLLTERFSK